MPTITWFALGKLKPPAKERLLLIVSAAGSPPDANLMGQSEVEVGYWTGDDFRLMHDGMPAPLVSHWASLTPCLPKKIKLKHERRFDPDVRS
jgi:hypothetical protein